MFAKTKEFMGVHKKMLGEPLRILLQVFFLINIFFTLLVVFFERKNPVSTWAWIIVLNIVPYFGFIIYLFLGLDARKRKIFLIKSKRDKDLYIKYLELCRDRNYFIDHKNAEQNKKISCRFRDTRILVIWHT